jgi:flagellar motor protein MotB
MLGSLVGGREDLGEVEFAAGEVTLNKENQERLRQLADALKKRPQLAVVVQGNSSFEEDKKAMQQQAVLTKVATVCKGPDTVSRPAGWLLEKENQSELRKINKALALKSEADRKSEIKAEEPNLVDEALTQKTYEQMFKDICEKQTISDQALTALADQRALSIVQYLIESGQLDATRISMKKANPDVLTGLITRIELEAR